MEISESKLEQLLTRASEMGAVRALEHLVKLAPYVGQSEAVQVYGRTNVENWVRDGKVKFEEVRGRIRIDRDDLLKAASISEMA
ncbi:MAG: hypothetical protein KBS70_06950 [Bacteroidales bacterium]|nr:hypothetical protein [Candidatus Colicola equi]